MKVHSPLPSRPHNSNLLSLWTRTKESNIFDYLFLYAFFFWGQEILQQHFLRHKLLHIYFGVCCFFNAIKNKCTNICDTNNCNAENFDAKNDVAKIKPQSFCGFICASSIFVAKFLCKKFLCNKFLSIYFYNSLFCGLFFCVFN